jgi:ribosomal protection tetracycline resistance protein
MQTLNLGILAHVDAGKTTLTERLLFAAGVIDTVGSVDDGTTQTDSLELERRRGITIKSAVVSFVVGDITVNLIDTPGHPDFIAEVERVLHVLDGVIVVISAVEGVQPQTRVLRRALQRLGVPALLFVNKIDRPGADPARVLQAIAHRLTPAIVPMGCVFEPGTRRAAFARYDAGDAPVRERLAAALGEHDDAVLDAYVANDHAALGKLLWPTLARLTRRSQVHPVFFGSALTGAGIDVLMTQMVELLPARAGNTEAPLSGSVFKIERGPHGEKVAYVRLFGGTVRRRDRLAVAGRDVQTVTDIGVFERGAVMRRDALTAGHIGKLWGLADVRIGDAIGTERRSGHARSFAAPTLESAIRPRRPEDKPALHTALAQLAEQDPLINLRQDDVQGALHVSLYGEVQKEVIQTTVLDDFGLDVDFHETTTVCVERVVGSGDAGEVLRAKTPTNVTGASSPTSPNPFMATLGLRIEPASPGADIVLRLDVDVRLVPIYIYKTVDAFVAQMETYVRETLQEGLCGWHVIDYAVTVIDCGYRAPSTTAADFRKLTPLVLMTALRRAGTVVCEQIHRFHLEAPAATLGTVLPALTRLDAVPHRTELQGTSFVLEGDVPVARVHALHQQLPAMTHGEGVLECVFDRYEPVRGSIPSRPRTDHNPLDRHAYLLRVARRL